MSGGTLFIDGKLIAGQFDPGKSEIVGRGGRPATYPAPDRATLPAT
jgi:hypothetical protein